MSGKQRGFLLYLDNYELIEDLSIEEKGQWIEAIFLYKREGLITEFPKGTLLKTAFKVAKSQLDRDSEAWNETCHKRAEAGRKGGLAKATNAKQKEAKATNAKQDLTNLADNDIDNDTDNVSVTDTDTDIVSETETEQSDFVSGALQASAAAECAEPAADLFTINQLMKKVKQNNVQLTKEGVKVFHEEMQETGWTLYGKPVERKTILRVLREYANKHPEYEPEPEEPTLQKQESEEKPEEKELSYDEYGMCILKESGEDELRECGFSEEEIERWKEMIEKQTQISAE